MKGEARLAHDDYRRSLDHTDPDNPGRAIATVIEVVGDVYRVYYGQKASSQLMRLTWELLGPPAVLLQEKPADLENFVQKLRTRFATARCEWLV